MNDEVLRTCKGCRRAIIWAKNVQTDAMIPLDISAPVYVVLETPDGKICSKAEAYVSHFVTCPKASQFSKKGKST